MTHEAQCRRCGVSCHVAVPLGARVVVVPDLHCRFLLQPSPGTFACAVYAERFRAAPWCHHADVAGPLGYLAVDCPHGRAEVGKVRVSEAEFAKLWPEIWRILRGWGVPAFIDQAAFLAMVARRTGRAWELVPWSVPADGDQPFAAETQQMRLRAATTSPQA